MIPRKYIDMLIVAAACVLAVYVGSHLVTLTPPQLGLLSACVFLVLWTLLAGDSWWAPILVGATVQGVFWVGFKVYPLEASVAIALFGLAPLLLVRQEHVLQGHRRPLPFLFYIAALYISLRMSIDILPAQGARGNLSRIYFNAIWPFFFGWLFYRYGKTGVLRGALVTVLLFLVARCVGAIAGYVLDIPLYIPGINYILTFKGEVSLGPMRTVAFSLLMVLLTFYHASRHWLVRLSLLLLLASSGVLMVTGEGRLATATFLLVPIAFFAWRRNWLFCVATAAIPVGLIAFVNLSPQAVDRLPSMFARSLSGMIVRQGVSETKTSTRDSDEWHSSLRAEGFSRWTQSPFTFLFGYGVRPSPELSETNQFVIDPITAVRISANVSAYESGYWTVLAVLGSTAFALYLLLFLHFWKQIVPAFLRRPRGTLEEGLLFWACYGSFLWYAIGDFQGGYPSLELFLVILAAAILEDARAAARAGKSASPAPAPIWNRSASDALPDPA